MLNSLTRVRKPRRRIGERRERAAVTANVISGEKCGA